MKAQREIVSVQVWGKLKTEVPGVRKRQVFCKALKDIHDWVPKAMRLLRCVDEVEVSTSFRGHLYSLIT